VIGDTEGGVTLWTLNVEAFSDEFGFAGVRMLSPPSPLVRISPPKNENTHDSCDMSTSSLSLGISSGFAATWYAVYDGVVYFTLAHMNGPHGRARHASYRCQRRLVHVLTKNTLV
jgi:hypothetical protein